MKSSFEPKPLPQAGASRFVPTLVHGAEDVAPDPSIEARKALEARASLAAIETVPAAVVPTEVDLAPLRDAVLSFETAAVDLRAQLQEEHRRWLWGALDVSLALAERVLERELSVDPAALHPLLERALAMLGDTEPIEVALPPGAVEQLDRATAEGVERARERGSVGFVADPALKIGEARVRAGASCVELRLETLLSMLRDELVPGWGEETELP